MARPWHCVLPLLLAAVAACCSAGLCLGGAQPLSGAATSGTRTATGTEVDRADGAGALPLVDPRLCSTRRAKVPPPERITSSSPARLAVVLTVCREDDVALLRELSCSTGGARVEYHLYLQCPRGGASARSGLSQLRSCLSVTEAPGRPAAENNAEHILAGLQRPPHAALYLGPETAVALVPTELLTAVEEAAARSRPWDFKVFLPAKTAGQSAAAPDRLCYAAQRFACLDACFARGHHLLQRLPPAEAFFGVSGQRMQTLLGSDYSWLKQWTAGEPAGADTLWPFLYGCPRMLGSPAASECAPGEAFRAGTDNGKAAELEASSLVLQPKALRVLPQECVARDLNQPPAVLVPHKPLVGVVLVFCDESLSNMRNMSCSAFSPQVVLHLYSKCGVSRAEALAQLGPVSACVRSFKPVPVTLETELAWTKHHREYLEHIIQRYDSLEPWTIFIKANFHRRRLSVTDMVTDVLSHRWEFKTFGGPKVPVDLDRFPESGDKEAWRREICALYRRYTCVDPCATPGALQAAGLAVPLYNTRSMWTASLARIRSLPVTEYQWWREYISAVPLTSGIKRRFMLERLWQVLLGCPEELSTTELMGCSRPMSHPSGLAVAPPVELAARGLTSWPQPNPAQFDPDAPYPGFSAPLPVPAVTFVIAVPAPSARVATVIKAMAVAATKFHPLCKFALLVEEGTELEELFAEQFWVGRMQVLSFAGPEPDSDRLWSVFQRAGSFTTRSQRIRVSRMELELCFLERLVEDAALQTSLGHLIMTDGRSLPLTSLYTALEPTSNLRWLGDSAEEGRQPPLTSISIVYAPDGAAPAVPHTWFVRGGEGAQAAAFLRAVLAARQGARKGRRDREAQDADAQALSSVLSCCMPTSGQADLWSTGGVLASPCNLTSCGAITGEAAHTAPLHLLLLPCDKWGAEIGGDRAEACPVRNAATKVMRFPEREVHNHVSAVGKLKDKASGQSMLKMSVLQLLKFHGRQLGAPLLQHYLGFLDSPAMRRVWMPPEKRGPPTIGPVPRG